MKLLKKTFLALGILFGLALILSITLLMWNDAPNFDDLSSDDQVTLQGLAESITEDSETPVEQLEALMHYTYDHVIQVPYPNNEYWDFSHDPLSILDRAEGQCFDLSYSFEMLSESLGFKVRHVVLTDGTFSHALSSVKLENGWILVDPSYDHIYLDASNQPLDARTVIQNGALHLNDDFVIDRWQYLIYGVYSWHGQMFEPKIHFPDVQIEQLIYNLGNIDLLPYPFLLNRPDYAT